MQGGWLKSLPPSCLSIPPIFALENGGMQGGLLFQCSAGMPAPEPHRLDLPLRMPANSHHCPCPDALPGSRIWPGRSIVERSNSPTRPSATLAIFYNGEDGCLLKRFLCIMRHLSLNSLLTTLCITSFEIIIFSFFYILVFSIFQALCSLSSW